MEIKRINTYTDDRFSQRVLLQHGCFLVDEDPYEIEIISDYEAVIRGKNADVYPEMIEEFRFYTPHITRFLDCSGRVVKEYPGVQLLSLRLEQIQPSQFYVDQDKIAVIREFIRTGEDIIIQVLKQGERYIALDGHTRLYYAVMMGWTEVFAVEADSDDYIFDFVEEAIRRDIRTPYGLQLVDHDTYERNWNQFCDDYFARRENKE